MSARETVFSSSDDNAEEELLTTEEAAKLLRLNPRTLANYRTRGGGPRFLKHGGRVFYRKPAVRDWSRAREHDTTQDY
ncbi:MAG: helix-turn-helix domain-containing protein [Amphiplicatus sp.]